MDDGRSLGLMIRGGAEYALGIYITGVDQGSAAECGGLKVFVTCCLTPTPHTVLVHRMSDATQQSMALYYWVQNQICGVTHPTSLSYYSL